MTTRIEVGGDPAAPRCTLGRGLLVPRRLPAPAGTVRVALVASTALLLGGDHVRVDVVVGAGHRLEMVETAGTVAYAMPGRSARWDVTIDLGAGATLTWAALPFVVADGARVERSTEIDLAGGAVLVARESLVLGRTGQRGGSLTTRTRARADRRPLLVESLVLDPDSRRDPAVLAGARCVDSVLVLGRRLPEAPGVLQLEGEGSIARRLVDRLHDSPLEHVFADAAASPAGLAT